MSTIYFVTHPEVVIDPQRPVPRWHLSDAGIARMRAFANTASISGVATVWASTETKAIEAAGIVAAAHGLPVSVHRGFDENDRSATGYLPPAEFQAVADEFFARPHESVRGWERAIDAQRRVVAAFEEIVSAPVDGDIAIVAHGSIGALLYCHLAGVAISRRYDQPSQGHYWTCTLPARTLSHGWKPIGAG